MTEKLTVDEIFNRLGAKLEASDDPEAAEIKEAFGGGGFEGSLHGAEPLDIKGAFNEAIENYEPEVLVDILGEDIEIVSYDSGGEGSAEDSPEFVLRYKETDQLFGKGGWYQSHHGTDWDSDWAEYEPVPTTVYRKK